MTILIFFAFMMVLMLILSIYAVVTEIQAAIKVVSAPGATISFVSFAWNTPAFRDIVIALGSTYGCYTVSSLIAFDPWHIITSMAWYLLLLPTYVNILMTYSCKMIKYDNPIIE